MNCPACGSANRAGAPRCKRCAAELPRTCVACGAPVDAGVELCTSCRTERVPAALGAEGSDDGDSELLDDGDLVEEPARFPTVTRFVGRKAQLDRLHAIAREAARGEPAFVALTGGAGVGKTRLVAEWMKQLQLSGTRVLYAQAGGPGAPPFAAFERLLRERFGLGESMSPSEARARLATGVAELVPAARATDITHLVAHLLRIPFPDSPVIEPLAESPAQLEARTFIAVKRLFAADGARGPLVLVIDDVELASPETVNLVHFLADGLGAAPVVILCVARPTLFDAHPSFGEGDAALTRLEVGPLDDAEAAELFGELCRPAGAPPAELVAHAQRLGGVPRALTELVHYLLELGAITSNGEGWRFDPARLTGAAVPDDLGGLVVERLRVMAAGERDLLEKAAACGEAFWLDAVVMLVRAAAVFDPSGRGNPDGPTLGEVAAAGDRTRGEVEAALSELARRGLVVERPHSSIPGEREYRFAYPPWWEVVYDRIDGAARSRYHRLVAQWLELRPTGRGEEEQEEIGRHLERAGDGDGAALHYRRAGDAARARFFNDKAARLYDAALNCLGQGDLASRIHLWHDLGNVFQLKGDFDAALSAFERMLRLAWVVASRTKAAVAFNKMGRIYRQKGELGTALENLERGLALFEQADDTRGIAGSLDDVGQVLWLLGRYDDALDRSAAALETRRRLGDKRAIAVSLVNIGNIERHRGLFDEAEACYQEALELRRALDDQAGIAQCENQIGVLAFQRGDVATARPIWERALGLAERLGALPLQALLLYHLGEAARAEGHREEARKRFEAAESLARDLDDKRLMSHTSRALGLVALADGDNARAKERIEAACEIAEQAGIRVDVGRALLALGEVHAATLFDDTGHGAQKAEDYFEQAVELFREIGNEGELAAALERFGKYRIERGDVADGKTLLTEAEAIFRRLGMRAGDALRRVIGEL